MVASALQREILGGQQPAEPYRHRIPLGLFMLSRHLITREQLSGAIEQQRSAGRGRIGEWLVSTQGVDEEAVAHALAAQWGLPFLPARTDARSPRLLPRLLVEAFGVIPLHLAARRILYLAVDEQVDRCLHTAIEWMTGYTVEPGVMKPSAFVELRRKVLEESAPTAKLFSAPSIEGLEDGIVDLIAERSASGSRLVRLGDYLWLRIETVQLALAPLPMPGPVEEIRTHLEDTIFTLPRAL